MYSYCNCRLATRQPSHTDSGLDAIGSRVFRRRVVQAREVACQSESAARARGPVPGGEHGLTVQGLAPAQDRLRRQGFADDGGSRRPHHPGQLHTTTDRNPASSTATRCVSATVPVACQDEIAASRSSARDIEPFARRSGAATRGCRVDAPACSSFTSPPVRPFTARLRAPATLVGVAVWVNRPEVRSEGPADPAGSLDAMPHGAACSSCCL